MMKKAILLLPLAVLAACTSKPATLKDALADKFLIGVAINENQIRYQDTKGDSVIFRHFNAIEPENCLKSEEIQPEKGVFKWELADKYVDFGTDNGLTVYGHCLIWHSQCPKWFCTNEDGSDVDPEELKARMKNHIYTLVGRYKGRIKGWDVVNEAINDDGSWRESPFYRILGEEYIPLAFQYAHEADPDAELYYNDYNMYRPEKAATVVKMVKDLKARGLRIDAVGFQGHYGMDYPDYAQLEKNIEDVYAAGVNIMFTEVDITILPTITRSADVAGRSMEEIRKDPELSRKFHEMMVPYPNGIPEERMAEWNERAKGLWELWLRQSDKIIRINWWSVQDGDNWKNGFPFPVEGREEAPLLFDRQFKQKPVVDWVIANADKY
jgi:endo-1,4-beta-xylanase